ncbi:hypothetical protein K435DRAFT_874894 [Dendrothele bispora CBS 962.96]|uniref:Uncharacterized protein n=1 Tax=Dendrothele bispora (strain CBS 962.96) TaxID=1314807 RepID=A0A4S8KVJ7_DENBC|nr:hypothetical protein K435DRAFT_874894 [Dendrothele bispora CBS 962.96]
MPFFREVLYQEPWDLASDLQMFGCKLNKTKPQSLAALRSDCANMISSSFRYIKRSKTIAMNYKQYETAIVQNHGVKLLWPKQVNNSVITNPSKLCADDIRILHRELELGTCRWVEVGQEGGKEGGKENSTPTENAASSKKRAARSDKSKPRKKTRLEDSPSSNTEPPPIVTSPSTAVSSTSASSNSTSNSTAVDSTTTQTSNVNLSNSGPGDPITANPSPSTSVIDTSTSNPVTVAPATTRRRGRPRKVQNSDQSTVNASKKRDRPKKTTVVYKSSDLINDSDDDVNNDGDCNEVD